METYDDKFVDGKALSQAIIGTYIKLKDIIHKYHPLPTDIKSIAVSRDENNSSPELTYSEIKK